MEIVDFFIFLLSVYNHPPGAVLPSDLVQVIYSTFGSTVVKGHTLFLVLSSDNFNTFVESAHEDKIVVLFRAI